MHGYFPTTCFFPLCDRPINNGDSKLSFFSIDGVSVEVRSHVPIWKSTSIKKYFVPINAFFTTKKASQWTTN